MPHLSPHYAILYFLGSALFAACTNSELPPSPVSDPSGKAGGTTGGIQNSGGLLNTGGFAGSTTGGKAADGSASSTVLRVQVNYDLESKTYQFSHAVRENSGTPALIRRARKIDPLGSFIGTVVDPTTQKVIYQQTIGTGHTYRELNRAFSFRFPDRAQPFIFKMSAEKDDSGDQEEVVSVKIDPAALQFAPKLNVEVRPIKPADQSPKLVVAFYAEAYLEDKKEVFFADAQKVVNELQIFQFPGMARFEFVAVWAPSKQEFIPPSASTAVPTPDTFLGLANPVWLKTNPLFSNSFAYSTDEDKTRTGMGQIPYDYPFVLINHSGITFASNYNMFAALPTRTNNDEFLKRNLPSEFAHFFGLINETPYGNTLFNFGQAEPWAPNLTYQTTRDKIKWGDLITASTIPTPNSEWTTGKHLGGYRLDAKSDSPHFHWLIPTRECHLQWDDVDHFCPVCQRAIERKIAFDSE